MGATNPDALAELGVESLDELAELGSLDEEELEDVGSLEGVGSQSGPGGRGPGGNVVQVVTDHDQVDLDQEVDQVVDQESEDQEEEDHEEMDLHVDQNPMMSGPFPTPAFLLLVVMSFYPGYNVRRERRISLHFPTSN